MPVFRVPARSICHPAGFSWTSTGGGGEQTAPFTSWPAGCMHAHMYAYMYHVCVCACVRVCACMCMCNPENAHAYVHAHACTCMHTHLSIGTKQLNGHITGNNCRSRSQNKAYELCGFFAQRESRLVVAKVGFPGLCRTRCREDSATNCSRTKPDWVGRSHMPIIAPCLQ